MSIETTTGLIGFFDILGYQEIIANNAVVQAAEIIKGSLKGMPERAAAEMVQALKGGDPQRAAAALNQKMKRLIISDTIILALPLESKDAINSFELWHFLSLSSYMLRRSFDAGLPLRGAIDYGEFYTEDYTFAGKPFVDSFSLARRLELSGCALTKALRSKIEEPTPSSVLSLVLFPYTLPFNDGTEGDHLVLDWLSPFPEWGEKPQDLRQYIVSKFFSLNKVVRKNVLPKLENTEIMLRYREASKLP